MRGPGVTLEPQVAAHAAELFAVLDDADVFRYIDAAYQPVSEEALRARLTRLESRWSPDGMEQWLNWVVRDAAGVVAGYVQATVYAGGDAEIAYVLGRRHWGRGLGFSSTASMLHELVGAYGVMRATATLDPDNAASLALLRKLGFRFDSEDAAAHEVRYVRDLAGAS